MTGDLHEAEEVVQEALAGAVPRWARLRAYDLPEAWVRRVALNLAVSHHRQARRRLAALIRLGPPPVVPPVSADALALAEALRALSMPHRQVLVLHHLLGLSVEEVARELASRWAPSRPGWRAAATSWPAVWPNPSGRCPTMNDLLDRLQELADAYARQASPPGPAAARRRSRARRRATVVAVAGVLVAGAATVGLLRPAREPPTPPLQPPGRPPGSGPRTCPTGSGSTPPKSTRKSCSGRPSPEPDHSAAPPGSVGHAPRAS